MPETCPYCDAELREYEASIAGAISVPGRYCPECSAYRVNLYELGHLRGTSASDTGYWVEMPKDYRGSAS